MGYGPAVPIEVATGTADATAYTGQTVLRGWSFRESAGTPAVGTLIIRDGTSTAGRALFYVELAANGSAIEWLGDDGVRISVGIFIDRVAGETEGTVFVS